MRQILSQSLTSVPRRASAAAVWPLGTDGALLIDGVTVNMAPTTKDYSSVIIRNGGRLNITGGTAGAWMIIGCLGNFSVDATSQIKYINVPEPVVYPKTATAPDGTVLSYQPIADTEGGTGGFDPQEASATGGNPASGNGGGGASFSIFQAGQGAGFDADASHGGAGNDGDQGAGAGGDGATTLGGAGQAGADSIFATPDGAFGAGGGGGFRGAHGGGIYIKVHGTLTLANPTSIDCGGSNGGNGGAGGLGRDGTNGFGGSGGGGGRGGSGGSLIIRMHVSDPSSININVTGGQGGAGGAGGAGEHTNPEGVSADGAAGSSGDAGEDGSSDIATY